MPDFSLACLIFGPKPSVTSNSSPTLSPEIPDLALVFGLTVIEDGVDGLMGSPTFHLPLECLLHSKQTMSFARSTMAFTDLPIIGRPQISQFIETQLEIQLT
jgi:hypothetical protein